MKKWQRKSLVAMAVASALGMNAGAAQADALATAVVDITNLAFFRTVAPTTIVTRGTDVDSQSFQSSALARATSNGSTISTGLISHTDGAPIDIGAGGTNPPLQCVGFGCNVDPRETNNAFVTFGVFTHKAPVSDPKGTFAFADQLESGSPVANIPDPGSTSGGTLPTGAHVAVAGTTAVLGGGDGDTIAANSLTSKFTFIADVSQAISIQFDASAYLESWDSAAFGTHAKSNTAVEFTICHVDDPTDPNSSCTSIFDWKPGSAAQGTGAASVDPFNLNANSGIDNGGTNVPLGYTQGVASTGHFTALTPILVKDQTYQLIASMGASSEASSPALVPEPGVLFLTGAGLLALWGSRRRSFNG